MLAGFIQNVWATHVTSVRSELPLEDKFPQSKFTISYMRKTPFGGLVGHLFWLKFERTSFYKHINERNYKKKLTGKN